MFLIIDIAYRTMINECLKYYPQGVETGGILLGVPDTNIILVAHPSSYEADRYFGFFYQNEKDTQYLNRSIYYYNQFGLDYVGRFHQHLVGLNTPSAIDLLGSVNEIKDPEVKIDQHVQIIVRPISETEANVFLYSVSRSITGEYFCRSEDYQVISLDNPIIESLIHESKRLCVQQMCSLLKWRIQNETNRRNF